MELIKIKTSPKTIKIEIRNTSNFSLDLGNIETTPEENILLYKLHQALTKFFKKEGVITLDGKDCQPSNQTNILDQINTITTFDTKID